MMNSPKVSVIIPNYNYADYLDKTIESVFAQTHKNLEVIVVDDGSSDHSLKVLAKYQDKIKIIQQENQGVSAARNHGATVSSGDYLAFLDADDLWMPEKLEKQINVIVNDKVGFVHVGTQEFESRTGNILHVYDKGFSGKLQPDIFVAQQSGNWVIAGGSGMMIPRSVFEMVGGFDARLSTSADWDFFFRVATRYEVAFINDVLLQYRIHNSNMHSNVERMEREMMICYEKVFEEADDSWLAVRPAAYGHLHKVLAGSYFHGGKGREFLRHGLLSLWLDPANITHYLKFPVRYWQRRQQKQASYAAVK